MILWPFGADNGESGSEDYRYTGKPEDPSGLYYYGARYYNPVFGRFITRDTVFGDLTDPQSQNRYVYCLNNPHKYIDPNGKDSLQIGLGYEIGLLWLGGTSASAGFAFSDSPKYGLQFGGYSSQSGSFGMIGVEFGGFIEITYSPDTESIEELNGVSRDYSGSFTLGAGLGVTLSTDRLEKLENGLPSDTDITIEISGGGAAQVSNSITTTFAKKFLQIIERQELIVPTDRYGHPVVKEQRDQWYFADTGRSPDVWGKNMLFYLIILLSLGLVFTWIMVLIQYYKLIIYILRNKSLKNHIFSYDIKGVKRIYYIYNRSILWIYSLEEGYDSIIIQNKKAFMTALEMFKKILIILTALISILLLDAYLFNQ